VVAGKIELSAFFAARGKFSHFWPLARIASAH
jgi:hypothetical protein